jgi:hypothetical protein
VARCACGGLARSGSAFSGVTSESPAFKMSSVGTLPVDDVGEMLLIAALGHPQTRCWPTVPELNPEYSGRARLA